MEYYSDIKRNASESVLMRWMNLEPIIQSEVSQYNVGDPGSIPALGRSPGEGNGNPLQYSSLGNLMNRGGWQVTVNGVSKSQTRLSD